MNLDRATVVVYKAETGRKMVGVVDDVNILIDNGQLQVNGFIPEVWNFALDCQLLKNVKG